MYAERRIGPPTAQLLPHSPAPSAQPSSFRTAFFSHVRQCVQQDPSLTAKTEVLGVIEVLERDGHISEMGSDDMRIKYVYLQGAIEHALACAQALGDIHSLEGMIHTPTVATPFCIQVGGPFESVLDASIRENPAKLLTVQSRAQIVREFLSNGGKFHIYYPESGLGMRSQEQLQIFQSELVRFSGHLFNRPLACEQLNPHMNGATYFFKTADHRAFAFSIKSRQANDVHGQSEWGMWFGSVEEPAIAERTTQICGYLAENRLNQEVGELTFLNN
ncbi:MAG: hypothetical protein V4492_03420 [Chlamydiota bacterium]